MPFDTGGVAGTLGNLFNTTQAGPAQAQANFAIQGPGGLNEQLGIGQQSSASQADYLRQMSALQQESLGLQGSDLNIQRGALNRQPALIGQEQNVSNLDYGNAIKELNLALQDLPQFHQMNLEGIQQQQGTENFKYGQDILGLSGQQGASGMSGGVAGNQAYRGRQLQHELMAGGPDLGFFFGTDKYRSDPNNAAQGGIFQGQHQQEGQFGRATRQENLTFGEQLQSEQDKLSSTHAHQDLSNAQFGEKFAEVGDQQKTLDNAAKQLGISSEELQARLQYGLGQIGLQNTLTSDQLLGEISQVQAGQFSPVAPFLGGMIGGSQAQVP